jgi:hypothetical protein
MVPTKVDSLCILDFCCNRRRHNTIETASIAMSTNRKLKVLANIKTNRFLLSALNKTTIE